MSKQRLLVGVLLAAGALQLARAGNLTASMQVSASVAPACTLATAPMNFGTINTPLTPQIDVSASLRMRCTRGLPVTIGLSMGSYAAGNQRRMQRTSGAVARINYSLFRNSQRNQAWSDTATTRLASTGTGADQLIPIYGRVPANQRPPVGSYSDTVVATVRY